MQDKNLDEIENVEDFERENDLSKHSDEKESDDIVFEDLNEDGEVMTEKEKSKYDKNKLKDKYEDKIERLEKERDEYLAGWQRMQADYKNREKEIELYKKDIIKFANTNLIKDILPVFDGYDMARNNINQWEAVDANWRVGVEYLFSQLQKVLENNGVEVFGKEGDEYNSNFYEAVEVINLSLEEKEKSGKIINVLQKGYKIGDKLLRAARVKIGNFEE